MPSDRRMFLGAGLGVTAALASRASGLTHRRKRYHSKVRRFPAMSTTRRSFAPPRPTISAASVTGNRAAC